MLIIYAVILPESVFKEKRFFRYVLPAYLVTLAFFCFSAIDFEYTAMRLHVKALARQAVIEMVGVLRVRHYAVEQAAQLMVPARRCGDFALALGAEQSQKFIYFREVLGPNKVKMKSGLALYVDYATRGFNFLCNPQNYTFTSAGKTYFFTPLYVTRNGLGIIYGYAPVNYKRDSNK